MNSFKPGSGDLDFGNIDGNDEDEEVQSTHEIDHENDGVTTSKEQLSNSNQSPSPPEQDFESESNTPSKYPYFVRRNNVGDERDHRLEIHVRDKVASEEAAFRAELAELLGVGEVSKTDAREFALLAAFRNPESVATRMQEEGFGELD